MLYYGNKVVLLDMFNKCELDLLKCYFVVKYVDVIIMYVSLYFYGNMIDKMKFYLKDFFINCMKNIYIYDKKKKEININDYGIFFFVRKGMKVV